MKSISLFMLCWFSHICLSQNLVPNPSFEEANTCYKYQEKCSPKGWRPTTLKSFRYNEFLGDRHKVKPPDGNRYISLIMYNASRTNERKFIQAPLLCPLIAGKTYRFSLHFKSQSKIVNQFGVYFPEQLSILKNNLPLLQVDPQIIFHCDENMEINTWQKLEGSFVASGKEQGIIIGNFFSDEQTQAKILKKLSRKQLKKNPPRSIIYYSFDHLNLIAQDSSLNDCDLFGNQIFIYGDTTRHISTDKPLTLADLPIVEIETIPTNRMDSFEKEIKIPRVLPKDVDIPIESSFVLENVLFENNSAKLLPVAYPSLDKILIVLQNNPSFQVHIIGHTDNVGNREDNLRLSQKRAQSIAEFLIDKGILSTRLKTSGQGEMEPIADNLTANGRAQNRRVAFYILK